jgi:Fanconi-associated nuclease 1
MHQGIRRPFHAHEFVFSSTHLDTHSTVALEYRPSLERRLKRLETKLKIDPAERVKCQGKLKKEVPRVIEGVRIWPDVDYTANARDERALKQCQPKGASGQTKGKSRTTTSKRLVPKFPAAGSKSIWQGKDGQEVTVEMFALEAYNALGYKGSVC